MNYTVVICAMLKDEHQYLKEWIDHHLSMGVDYIYLYEDITSKSHQDIVKEYDNVYLDSIGNFINMSKTREKQQDLYNEFIKKYKNKHDYCFFIDLDEFVVFEEGYGLKDLVTKCNNMGGALMIPWKYFGADGHIDNPKTPLMTTYTTPSTCKRPNKSCVGVYIYKTFCSLKRGGMVDIHVHSHSKPIVPCDSKNIYQLCWLNHYITKSWEEWCTRIFSRGQNKTLIRKIDEFFMYNPDMLPLKEELYSKDYCKI